RKEAGRVRDLDVILKLLGELNLDGTGRKLAKKIKRTRAAESLHLVKLAREAKARKTRAWAKRNLKTQDDGLAHLIADTRRAFTDEEFATLGEHNLHDFRLAIKPLRYRAELLEGAEAEAFASHLNAAQTAIGDWHDWMMLRDFIRSVAGNRRSVLAPVESELEAGYRRALQQAVRLRDQLSRGSFAAAA
ncbi:MAG: CHAD domain-containing protein, partial [Acidobacteriales bacterium]|nr:CHAD domain-containing protein [Terriglobales bacterium]